MAAIQVTCREGIDEVDSETGNNNENGTVSEFSDVTEVDRQQSRGILCDFLHRTITLPLLLRF
jgi:hypothetical protein